MRQQVVAEERQLRKKMRRDRDFRNKAIQYIAKEVRRHYEGRIDVLLAGRRTSFFLSLAKSLGRGTKVRVLRSDLHLDRGQIILHAQEIAFGRKCLEDVRTKMLDRPFAPFNRQFVPVVVALVASRTAIEIDGVPVVSLNNGCPSCNSRLLNGE